MRLGAVALLLVVGLSGCARAEPTLSDALATMPARPSIPEGWVATSSDSGDVELTAPMDFAVLLTQESVLLQTALVDGRTPIEVWLSGPTAVFPQPEAGQSIRAWLFEDGSWAPTEADGVTLDEESERELLLPAGRALELAWTVQRGAPEASRLVLYAISTERGIAILRILGHPDAMRDRADDLMLMARLMRVDD